MTKTKMIAVSPQNWEAIRKFGEYGDTMNTIVSKILNKIDTLPSSNSNDNDDIDKGPGTDSQPKATHDATKTEQRKLLQDDIQKTY